MVGLVALPPASYTADYLADIGLEVTAGLAARNLCQAGLGRRLVLRHSKAATSGKGSEVDARPGPAAHMATSPVWCEVNFWHELAASALRLPFDLGSTR